MTTTMADEPRPAVRGVVWALCGIGAGVLIGFVLGLARPRPYAAATGPVSPQADPRAREASVR